MKRFYIVANKLKDKNYSIAEQIKKELLLADETAEVIIGSSAAKLKEVPESTECLIVLGGDGTVLLVAKQLIGKEIPLIGINLGAVGYLTEVEPSGIGEAAQKLVRDDFVIENRMMLEGFVHSGEKDDISGHALNDIVLTRCGELQVIGYRIYVNGMYLNDFFADGVILSTPTGSTGYNLSAGGSIVEPAAKLIVLTPVCPHTLNTRSIILSPEDKIEIEILPPKGEKPVEVAAYFDGGNGVKLVPGDRLKVNRSEHITRICKLSDVSFLEVLHHKISE